MSTNILVPVDGSEHADKALDLAADLARMKDGSIHLMHVLPSHEVPEGLREYMHAEHIHETPSWLMESGIADGLLNAAKDRLRSNGVNDAGLVVEHGNVAKCIVEYAGSKGMDMIVMGTRGFSDLQGLIMGSVAHKVSHAAPCTVVTVRG